MIYKARMIAEELDDRRAVQLDRGSTNPGTN